jgi:ABC-type uncharacterized transport system permease subunit
MLGVLVAAAIAGVVAALVANALPHPSDLVGAVLAGAVTALAVIVAYLVAALRDRDRRLDRIERIVSGLHLSE